MLLPHALSGAPRVSACGRKGGSGFAAAAAPRALEGRAGARGAVIYFRKNLCVDIKVCYNVCVQMLAQ